MNPYVSTPYSNSRGQEKPSALTKEHPVLQNMNLFYFFQIFAGHFSILHPDEQHLVNQKGKALNRDRISFHINMYTYLKTYLFVYFFLLHI